MTDGAAADRLRLMQWLSPAFPIGGYAYSHGLETVIAANGIADADALAGWIAALCRHGAGRSDAVLLLATLGGRDAAEMHALASALAASAERWAEARDQGAAFAAAVSAQGPAVPPLAWPVAFGLAARRLSLPPGEIAAAWLHAFAANLVSVGTRAVPLGAVAAQAALARLAPVVTATVDRALTTAPEDIATATPGGDMAAMAHETLQPRLFVT